MIKTLIVDDEVKGRLFLRQLCETFEPRIKVTSEASSAAEALEIISLDPPELVFLDIEMPRQSGIEMLASVKEIPFEVVFVTAFNQYAVDAFRLGAVDYLLKPVGPEELIRAVDRVERNLKLSPHRPHVQALVKQFGDPFTRITLPTMNGYEFIDLKEIVYIESESNYSILMLLNGRKVTTTRGLGDFEETLEGCGFFRIHKSFVINLSHIQKYIRGEGGTVVMAGGVEIDVARRKKEAFLERIRF
jgi:two-component system, LytTR family, response regulator